MTTPRLLPTFNGLTPGTSLGFMPECLDAIAEHYEVRAVIEWDHDRWRPFVFSHANQELRVLGAALTPRLADCVIAGWTDFNGRQAGIVILAPKLSKGE